METNLFCVRLVDSLSQFSCISFMINNLTKYQHRDILYFVGNQNTEPVRRAHQRRLQCPTEK